MPNNKKAPEVESYRLDQVEKSLEKFVERIEGKIDRLADTFATRSALDIAITERNAKIMDLTDNVASIKQDIHEIKSKKAFATTLSVVVAIVSAGITIITLYELFNKKG